MNDQPTGAEHNDPANDDDAFRALFDVVLRKLTAAMNADDVSAAQFAQAIKFLDSNNISLQTFAVKKRQEETRKRLQNLAGMPEFKDGPDDFTTPPDTGEDQ